MDKYDDASALDLRKFLEKPFEHKPILCPSCGFEYVHLGPIHILQGTHSYQIGDGLTIEKVGDVPIGRGAFIKIDLWCEDGHRSQLEFNFHKGMTYITSREIATQGNSNDSIPELWRD